MELQQTLVVYVFIAIQSAAVIAVLTAAARSNRRLVRAAAFFAAAAVGPGIGDWLEIRADFPPWLIVAVQSSVLLMGPSLRYLEAALDAGDEEARALARARRHLALALALSALLAAGISAPLSVARAVAAAATPLCLVQTALYLAAGFVGLARRAGEADTAARSFLLKIYVAGAAAWLVWALRLALPDVAFLVALDRLSLAAMAVLAMFWGARGAMRERLSAGRPYEKSGLDGRASEALARRLVEALERDGLFSDPDLDLKSLAAHLREDPRKLSQAFGQSLGTTFARYVSDLRLARYRELAADPGLASRSILDLALEAGFGSKSRFNQLFRERYGETPSSHRARVNPASSREGESPSR